jgi:large repetitive protein
VTGRPYEARLETAGGTGERTLAVSGTPPAGLRFDGERIAGTAAREEMGTIRVRVSDAAGREAARDFPFAAVEPLTLATKRMPTARTGEEYRESIPVTGGMPPYALEILDPLPEGLALDPETGEIAGTPTEAIWTHVRIAATDGTTPAQRMEGILEVRADAPGAESVSRAPSN